MHLSVTRRAFVIGAPALCAAGAAAVSAGAGPDPAPPDHYPQQDPDLVRKAVGFSHGNIDGLRELLQAQPELAKASWDWGFGDWETCLGAASHTGRVAIAELLFEHGARPTIFSATMLGHLDVVKAFVAAQPGIQRTLGPHGITLLAHARAGGERAAPVAAYLDSLADAGVGQQRAPLSDDDLARCLGVYSWSADERSAFIVETRDSGGLFLKREGGLARGLSHQGGLVFTPAGAPSTIVAFDAAPGEPARSVRVTGAGRDIVASRGAR